MNSAAASTELVDSAIASGAAVSLIFHKLVETICGHVSCSFLALVLKKELEDRIANLGKPAADGDAAQSGSWPDTLADLDSLTETEVEQDGKRFLLRSPPLFGRCSASRPSNINCLRDQDT